jgi:hypothetical protein
MSARSALALWLSRLTLIAFAFIFTSVSLRFLIATLPSAEYLGMATIPAKPSLGTLSLRVGYGIYPLGFVIVSLYCLFTSQLRAGALFVAVLMVLLLGVRIINGLHGGTMAENSVILVGESVLLTLSLVSVFWIRTAPAETGSTAGAA